MEKLLKLLKDIRPDIDFTKEERLIDDVVLDSFDIITMLSEINYVFDININASDLAPENFNSVDAMMKLIKTYQ